MNRLATRSADRPERRDVLSKAVVRTAERLDLSGRELAGALGLSPASVSRLLRGGYTLDPRHKSWELATMLVRLVRGLDAITADDERAARVSFNGFAERAKQMLGVTTLEIEETVEKLAGMGVVEVGQFKTGEHKWERAIRVFDPHGFRDQVERFLQTWQGEAGVHFLNQGFVELDEIARRPAVRRGRMVNRTWGAPARQLHERHDASDFELRTADKLEGAD